MVDLTPTLVPDPTNKAQHNPKPEDAEADLEGAARIGDRIYWIASHSHSNKGNPRVDRYRFFATDIDGKGADISIRLARLAGAPKPFPAYMNLLTDMAAAEGLKDFKFGELDKSPTIPEKGGINIEGLTATRDGKLLIAFRSPLSDKKALLVPLENPDELVEGKTEQARFGAPFKLNLDGLGVRDVAYWKQKDIYLILAGSVGSESVFKLYQWQGSAEQQPTLLTDRDGRPINFDGLNPEALVVLPNSNTIQVISDDGDLRINPMPPGKSDENKKMLSKERLFRTAWLSSL